MNRETEYRYPPMRLLILACMAAALPSAPCDAPDTAIERVAALRLAGELSDALALAERALACDDLTADTDVELWVEAARIHDRFGLHRNTRPVAAALDAIDAAAAVAGAGPVSRALVELAYADYHYRAGIPEGEFARSRRHGEAAVRLYEQAGDLHGQADAVHKLGLMAMQEGDLAAARRLFDRSLELDRAGGARPWFCGEYERHVAMVDDRAGDLAAALPRYRRSLACRLEAGAIDASLFAAVSLGSALVRAGRPAAAAAPLAYAAELADRLDSTVGGMYADLALGRLHEALGELAAARAAFARALETAEAVGSGSAASARAALERLSAAPEATDRD